MFEHFEYLSLTQLGKLYGVSAIKIGRCLGAIGLRENGQPTHKALEEGYANLVEMDQSEQWHAWCRTKTIAAFAELGLTPIGQQSNERNVKPADPIDPPKEKPPAIGPFVLKQTPGVGLEIVDANGIVRLWATDETFADDIVKLINEAHERLEWWA